MFKTLLIYDPKCSIDNKSSLFQVVAVPYNDSTLRQWVLDLDLDGWSANSHEGQRVDSAASRPLKEVTVSASAALAGSWFHSGIVPNMVERQRGEQWWLARGLSRRWSPFRLFRWVFLMFTSSGGMAKCPFIILYSKMSLWSRRRFARSFHPRSRRRPVTLTVPYWLRDKIVCTEKHANIIRFLTQSSLD